MIATLDRDPAPPGLGPPRDRVPDSPRTADVVAVLALSEGVRLVRHPAFVAGIPLTLALLFGTTGEPGHEWRSWSTNVVLVFVPLAWLTLVTTNLMALRDRRHGSTELLDTAPATPGIRTAALILAPLATVPVTSALLVAAVVHLDWRHDPVGAGPVAGELAVAVLLVVGGGIVGVAVARWLPHPMFALPAVVVTAWLTGAMSTSMTAPSRWLGFWVDASPLNLEALDPRPAGWHLVWLAAWCAVMAAVAIGRHGLRRPVAILGAAAIAVAGLAGWHQTRPLGDARLEEMASMLREPAAHQSCEIVGGVRYCAYPGYQHVVGEWRAVVEGVLAAVPAAARRPLEVRQRIATVLGNPDCGDEHALDVLDPKLRARLDPEVVWRLDGAVHPPIASSERLPCGGASVAWFFTGVQTGAWAVSLPPAPWGRDQRCTADHQARAAVALWLGAQATPDGADHLRAVRRGVPDRASRVSFAGRWNEHPQWGVHWHVADLDAALGLLGLPAARVRDILDQHWEDLVEPSTPTHALLALAGLPQRARSTPSVSTCPPLDGA